MPTAPAPIVVEPSGRFEGNDGSWSSLLISVGTPPKELRVLASTQAPETWVVLTEGCVPQDPSNCTDTRGGTFDTNASNTWTENKVTALKAESNLGHSYTSNSDYGDYGVDTLAFGSAVAGGVSLKQQVVAGIATKDFYLGSLGLSSRAINATDPNHAQSAPISVLKAQGLIPSVAYGYTAGAWYRNATASLTFGGYDLSRMVPNELSFTFAPDPTRQLLVAVRSITTSDASSSALLPKGVLALIDSTIPDIWLPTEACQAFEKAFDLADSYDIIRNRYPINDTLHAALQKRNASITFELANELEGGPTINITLPYAALDLEIGPPWFENATRYFPLRRAGDSSKYTLGRTVLQESFLTVNYEHNNFSISRCVETSATPHIVAISDTITPATTATATSAGTITSTTESPNTVSSPAISHSLSTGTAAGIAIAIIVFAVIGVGFAISFMVRRRRQKRKISELPAPNTTTDPAETPLCYQTYTSNETPGKNGGPKSGKDPEVQTYELTGDSSQETVVNTSHERSHGMTIELGEGSVPPSELPSPAPTYPSPGIGIGSLRTLSSGLSPPSSELEAANRESLGFFDYGERRRSTAISPPHSPPLSSPGLSSMHSMPSPNRWDLRSTTVSPEPSGSRTATPSPEPVTPRSELPSRPLR